MKKIVLIGSGGAVFAMNFIKDILISEELRHCEIALMDLDPGRLERSVSLTRMIGEKLGVTPNCSSTTDLDEAVKNADYVITIFRSGTYDHQRIEYEIPLHYGVDQVVGDSAGPGGVFRGLRTLKALFEVVDALERHCPGATLLNYVNPMSMNTIALQRRAKTITIVGLCHSVPNTASTLADYIGVKKERISYLVGGINHQAFFLKFEVDGEDAYPRLRVAMDNPAIYRLDRVRFELFRHFDYFPTESSGHGSEYIPYIRKRCELIEEFCSLPPTATCDYSAASGTSGSSVKGYHRAEQENKARLQALLDGSEAINLTTSNEYAVQIIKAIENDIPIHANLNVINQGLISTLPPECCVEVPCQVDASGVTPSPIDHYPEQLAGLNRGLISMHLMGAEGALESNRHKVFQAIALDPLTAAVCSLNEIQSMVDDLFGALQSELDPHFYG